MFDVIGYDSFSKEEYQIGVFKTEEQAVAEAKKCEGTMNLVYVYNRTDGTLLYKGGTY